MNTRRSWQAWNASSISRSPVSPAWRLWLNNRERARKSGDADAPACATVWQNDSRVGLVTSGGFGHTLGRSIALAYVRTDLAGPGTRLDIEILGERRGAIVGREPLYDPTNARLKM
jgi:glycine cleavage system aminomethyltransferase T